MVSAQLYANVQVVNKLFGRRPSELRRGRRRLAGGAHTGSCVLLRRTWNHVEWGREGGGLRWYAGYSFFFLSNPVKSLFGANSSYSISNWRPNKDSSHRIRILCTSSSAEARSAYFRTTQQQFCSSSETCCARKPNKRGDTNYLSEHGTGQKPKGAIAWHGSLHCCPYYAKCNTTGTCSTAETSSKVTQDSSRSCSREPQGGPNSTPAKHCVYMRAFRSGWTPREFLFRSVLWTPECPQERQNAEN